MIKQKKIGRPTQPSHRSAGYRSRQLRKPILILHRAVFFFKSRKRRMLLFLIPVGLILLQILFGSCGNDAISAEAVNIKSSLKEETDKSHAFIFMDGDGHPIDVQLMTNAWATKSGFKKRYNITDTERWEIASVITAEAAGEPFAGKVAVAQCILQTCEDDEIRPTEVLSKYGYSTRRPEPTEESLETVEAVFDLGHVATTEPIKYFYAPALVTSDWHESQIYVMTINGHRFFKEAD